MRFVVMFVTAVCVLFLIKKCIAAVTLNFKARSFQTARALLTGSSPGLLDT